MKLGVNGHFITLFVAAMGKHSEKHSMLFQFYYRIQKSSSKSSLTASYIDSKRSSSTDFGLLKEIVR